MLGSTGVEIPKLHVIRQALALRARRPEAVGSAYEPPPPTESTCAYRAPTSAGWTCWVGAGPSARGRGRRARRLSPTAPRTRVRLLRDRCALRPNASDGTLRRDTQAPRPTSWCTGNDNPANSACRAGADRELRYLPTLPEASGRVPSAPPAARQMSCQRGREGLTLSSRSVSTDPGSGDRRLAQRCRGYVVGPAGCRSPDGWAGGVVTGADVAALSAE